jgi:hypothetical protein
VIPVGALVTVPPPEPSFPTLRTGFFVKVAVTDLEPSIATVQVVPVPVHAPLHPPNAEPAFGSAVNVTLVPGLYGSLQSFPQVIPPGELVTVPSPAPAFVTSRTGLVVKVAVTDREALIVSVHVVDVPVHAPPHPANVDDP